MALLKSLALSLVLSAAATYLLRRMLSANGEPPAHPSVPVQHINPVVVVVPVLVGNSGNKIFEIRPQYQTFPFSSLRMGRGAK